MTQSRGHRKRRHIAPDRCQATNKVGFTTWDAAQAAVVTTPDAERHYLCSSCGYRHITRYEEGEYAQRVADKEYGHDRTEQAAERRDATAAAFKRLREARPASAEAAHAS